MDLSEFEVGSIYRLKIAAWETPTGDIVPAEEKVRRVLEQANCSNSAFDHGPVPDQVIENWSAFLRVQCPNTGKVHLLHPETIEGAEKVTHWE